MNPILEQIELLEKKVAELKQQALKENEFKVGDWVIVNGYSKKYDGKPLKINKIYVDGYDGERYYYFYDSLSKNDNFSSKHRTRHATKEEIEQHLIKEAEKRGFKIGVRYKCAEDNQVSKLKDDLHYLPKAVPSQKEMLTDHRGGAVYFDGKWATIIEDKIMIDKYEVEFRKDKTEILVGGNFYYKQSIENILQLQNFKALIMHDCSGKEIRVEKETIQKIYERLQ